MENLHAAGFTGLQALGGLRVGATVSPALPGGWPLLGTLGQGAWHRKSASRGWPGLLACTLSTPAVSLPAQPMNATSAFGPNLRYIVKWRRRETRETWNNVTVWGSRYVVGQTPVYVPYEIRVQAENDFGKGPEPDTVIGYSGEDCEYPPLSPPRTLTAGLHRPPSQTRNLRVGRGSSESILGGQPVPREEKSPTVT